MRDGVRLGIDVGRARVGVARSDAGGLLATPVETIARDGLDALVARIREIRDELDAVELVVGLPLSLSGVDTASTQDARDVADALAVVAPVRLVDERLSTVTAQQSLRQAGRSSRRQRSVIDQVAAVVILQHALDAERAGRAPGTIVDHEED